MSHVVLIANPISASVLGIGADALAVELTHQLQARGDHTVDVFETESRDGGAAAARDAVVAQADLVVVAGGDATVRTVAEGLAGSGIPMAVVPMGAGNLLARNLGIPLDPVTAITAGLDGDDVRLDLGRLDDGAGSFAVMAGIGADAAVVQSLQPSTRSGTGWPGYTLARAASVRSRGFGVEVSLDGRPALRRRAVSVLIGNVGRLRSEALLPAADPAPGALDVCVLAPRTTGQRVRAAARFLLRRPAAVEDDRWERWQARSVLVRAAERQPRQLDGEPIASSSALDASVVPGAVLVRVPAGTARQPYDVVDLTHGLPAAVDAGQRVGGQTATDGGTLGA
ncbi:MAG: diacylglycerol kinase family protein [Kineosporiaceae bacterium]